MLANLQDSSVYVSLSRSDGTSISLLEALSCGLFPILSDIPQNREWIDPSLENGILVPLDRPVELAAALRRAVTDASLRERAAVVNRRLIEERADARRNMTTLASRLQEMVHGRGDAR
jgi:glycosyltransferase involved in cell wall biosynthesis